MNNSFSELYKRVNKSGDEIPNRLSAPELCGRTVAGLWHIKSVLSNAGAEATIYLAENKHGAAYAFKLYHRRNAIKPGVIEKLRRLENSHIAAVSDSGEIDGFPYTVSPYYDGVTLDKSAENGIVIDEQLLKELIIPSVIDGLKTLHSCGIIHKDLKPANILLSTSDNTVKLIDFGISSETDARTLVVTHTGKTPLYAAPETFSGLFSELSDYYALGITVYELLSGKTPFEDEAVPVQSAAGLAMVRKISFPESFSDDFRNLVLGLTYRDISSRHEDDGAHRWGYEEVKRWLEGEFVPVPGEGENGIRGGDYVYPYFFKGKNYHTPENLAEVLLADWSAGKKELLRGMLERHYELNGLKDEANLCQKTQRLIETMTEESQIYNAFGRMVYALGRGGVHGIYWKNYYFDSLADLGNQLLDAAFAAQNHERRDTGSSEEIFEEAYQLLATDFLEFVITTAKGSDSTAAIRLLKGVKQRMSINAQPKIAALNLGYAATGRTDFYLSREKYDRPQQYYNRMHELYLQDLPSFIGAYDLSARELSELIDAMPEELALPLKQVEVLKGEIVSLANGKYMFRNSQETFDFADKLWTSGSSVEYYMFMNSCLDKIGKCDQKQMADDRFEQHRNNLNSMLHIRGVFYRSIDEFAGYFRRLAKCSVCDAAKFMESRMDDLSKIVMAKRDREFICTLIGSVIEFAALTKLKQCGFFTQKILKRMADFRVPFRADLIGSTKDGISVRVPFLVSYQCLIPQNFLGEAATVGGLKLSASNDKTLKGKQVSVCISAMNGRSMILKPDGR